MAQLIVLSVRDRAMDAFMQPFFAPAVGLAVRSFGDEINRAESPMHAHPEDYDLYQVGTFDDQTGIFTSDQPRMLAVGKDHIRSPK